MPPAGDEEEVQLIAADFPFPITVKQVDGQWSRFSEHRVSNFSEFHVRPHSRVVVAGGDAEQFEDAALEVG